MTTADAPPRARRGILGADYVATTIGMFALIAFVAFEAMAVTTIMPTVARDLDGVEMYALAFAAPLASGVVGMVAAGAWSDRRGPVVPLLTSSALFAVGLIVCGLAPDMAVLVGGRVVQGLGGGALSVGLYVTVGLLFPAHLRPSVFASFAAAWVLPALFGPALAAWIAQIAGWRWVFLGAVALVAAAVALILPALRGLRTMAPAPDDSRRRAPLGWAGLAAGAVLAVELLGSQSSARSTLAALAAGGVLVVAVRRLVPAGTLLGRPGLPAVIATRGLLAATFFTAEAYLVFVLQERWGLSPGQAGLALTCVGVVWAAASQAQARLGTRVSDTVAMRVGSGLVLAGVALLGLTVLVEGSALVAAAGYVAAGAGMGFGYPRTGTAMLAASGDGDRGFNSSALSIADALGGAISLAAAGVVFAAAGRASLDPFAAVFAVATVVGVVGAAVAFRTGPPRGWAQG